MWRSAGLCVLTLLSLTPQVFAQDPAPPPSPERIEGATSYIYKQVGPAELRLHVFGDSPVQGSRPRAAIILFFGGGFTRGNVGQFSPQARHLAERGMVVILADYRVQDRHGTSIFEAIADAKSAIRWVRSRAKDLGVDPDRIAAGGGSSGGHLALTAAVFSEFDEPSEDGTVSSRPNALILFNPAVNLERAAASDDVRFRGRALEASPFHHLERAQLPSTLIQHGRADTAVPFSEVEDFCRLAVSSGFACRLVGYDEAPHGFFNPGVQEGRWYTPTLLEADRFLVELGYLPEP